MSVATLLSSLTLPGVSAHNEKEWDAVVRRVRSLPRSDTRVMAFTYTIRQLRRSHSAGHSLCDDPLCPLCNAQIIANYDGSQGDLLSIYHKNLNKVESRIKNRKIRVRPGEVALGTAIA